MSDIYTQVVQLGTGADRKNTELVGDDNPLPVKVIGGAGLDRELVVSTYTVKTAFAGASVGDTITMTQVIDVSGSPSTAGTIWRNQSTASDLVGAPSAANLTLVGSQALTDGQLRAAAVAISAASLPLPAGAATDAAQAAILAALPASLGIKTAAGSLSIAQANNNVFLVTGMPAVTLTNRDAIAVSDVGAALVSANADRRSLRFTNIGTDPVALGFTGITWAKRCIVLVAGDTWVEDRAANMAWAAITDAAKTASVTTQEVIS